MTVRIFAVTLALALLAAACGDSGETTTTDSTQPPDTTPVTATAMPPQTDPGDGGTFLWAGATYPRARYEACFGQPDCPDAVATDDLWVGLKREFYGQLLETYRDVAFRAPPGEENLDPDDPASSFCAYDPRLILYRTEVINRDDLTSRPNIDDGFSEQSDEFSALVAGIVPNGVGAVRVVPPADPYDEVLAIIDALGLPNDGSVGLNYVYLAAPRWQWGPGSDPFPAPAPAPPPPVLGSGAEVLVFDVFRPREVFNGVRDPVTGHGEFIVDIVEQLGSTATTGVNVDDDSRELITDLTFFEAVSTTESVTGAVVNASFGIYPCAFGSGTDTDYLQPVVLPNTLQAIVDAGAVLVAAAGNDGLAAPPFMPAAYAVTDAFGNHIVSVGAFSPGHLGDPAIDYADRTTLLDASENAVRVSAGGAVADFSNHGDWVEVYAPGVFVPATYPAPPATDPDGLWHGFDPTEFVYTYQGINDYQDVAGAMSQVDPAQGPAVDLFPVADTVALTGLAQWSGTSFAAPHVAAAIAAAATGNKTVLMACGEVFDTVATDVCGP